MNNRNRLPFQLTAASALVLATSGALAQEADPYAPLAAETRPLQTRWQNDYSGAVQLGLGYTSDDNYMFGQYNGRQKDEATLIGNLQWQDFRSGDSYGQLSMSDLGLGTREGEVTWGNADHLRSSLGCDWQEQVGNDSGRTRCRGDDKLRAADE